MMSAFVKHTICLAFVYPFVVFAQTSNNTKDLLTQLFTTQSYNKYVRPQLDQSMVTLVFVDFTLVGFNGLDEVQQKLTITGYLLISWVDQHLSWTPSTYGGVNKLYINQQDIWKPDLALQNGFKELEELGSKFVLCQVSFDGSVVWMPFEVFETRCDVNIKYFPFDQQNCTLKFVVWSHSIHEINITAGIQGLNLEVFENGEWEIVGQNSFSDLESFEARVSFSMRLQRKPLYIVLNIIMPVVFLSVLNLFVFMLPADSGEKMGYSITVFLSFAVFLTIVSDSLPDNSEDVPLLSVYLILQLSVGTLTVIVTSLQLRLNFRDENTEMLCIYKIIVRIARVLQCKSCSKCRGKTCNRVKTEVEELPEKKAEDESEPDDISWKDVSSAIDFLLFCFFTLFFIICTSCTLLISYTSGNVGTTPSTEPHPPS